MSDQSQMSMFGESNDQTLSPLEVLARTLVSLENGQEWKEREVLLSPTQSNSLLNSDQTFLSGKMLKEHSPQMMAQTFGRLSKPLPTLGVIDLNGNCLIRHGFYPKIESEYTLSELLEEKVAEKYFLSGKAIAGLMKGQGKPQLLDVSQQEETAEGCTPT